MRTVVAAPFGANKAYALGRWAAATENYERLLVTDELKAIPITSKYGIPTVLYESVENPRRPGKNAIYGPKFNQAWEAILANTNGHTHVLALDTDVIPKGDILTAMEAEYDGTFAFLRHGVPWRSVYRRPECLGYETSCTLATVEAWRAALDKAQELGPLCTLYEVVGNPNYFTHKDINLVELEHLDDGVDARQ
jgi:TorA maturation chaperone TorD